MGKYRWSRLAVALLCCLTWLLGACTSSTGHPAQVNSPLLAPYRWTPFTGSQPRGTLTMADTGFPVAPNPLFASSRFDMEVSSALWASPVVFDAQFHVQPDQLTEVPLPENGDVLDGGRTIIMRLRHDLRWSDGQPVQASDFAYWWHLNQNPATGAITTSGYDQIAEITTPDAYTVVLHMKQPFGPYLSYLPYAAPEHAWGHSQPIELQNQASVFQAPAVTDGPYKLERFMPGQSYTLAPNPFYHSTSFHGPFLAHLTYRSYPTAAALSAAVRAGQVDVAEGFTENDEASLGALPASMQLQVTPASAYEHLDFNLAHPLWQDLRVRQAIQLALDRCAFLRKVLHTSDCSRLTDQVEPWPSLVNNPDLHAPTPDLQAARSLLKDAGWAPGVDGWLYKQGQPFVVRLVTTSGNALRAALATMLQRTLATLGIQVKLAFYDLATFFGLYSRGGVLATGAYDLALFGYANAPDPDDEYTVFHSSQIPDAAHPDLGNYGRITDSLIDDALTQGRFTVAFSTRVQLYQRFLARLASQVYLIPLYTAVNIRVVNSRLRNAQGNPQTLANNWNIADWWLAG